MTFYHFLCRRIFTCLAPLLVVTFLGNCEDPEPEYHRVLVTARVDCKGNEIVGVWTASTVRMSQYMKGGLYLKASVLLIRPDGTGLRRDIYHDSSSEQNQTTPFQWRYQGTGVWTTETSTIRFSGTELSWEEGIVHFAYIRTGTDSANETAEAR